MLEINLALEERTYNNSNGTFFVDATVYRENVTACGNHELSDFDYKVTAISFSPEDGTPEIDLDAGNAEFYIKDLFDQVLEASND